jgi:hypothetical protein
MIIDDKGLNEDPTPVGENQEKAKQTIAATLKGENRFENSLATLCAD